VGLPMTLALTEAAVVDTTRADVRSPARAKYRADVDGLRAVAVLSVLLFHGGVAALSGGYVGVDVFFVISGFVIATKLVEEIEGGKFSIANFYVRRIRRILPALVVTILLSYVAALVFFLPDAMEDFSKSVVATATFLSNMFFWQNSGYFETGALDRPLLHTWSLAIEEQFYIIIPIVLFFLITRVRRLSFAIFALGAAASLALSIFITDKAPTANFFVLPTRAWELLLGVMVALAPWAPTSNRILRELIALAGFGLIIFAVVTYTSATPFPGLAAFVPTFGTAALIYLGKSGEPTFVASGLSLRPVVAIGLISYSLYMVHWPIIVFARYALLRDLAGWEIVAAVTAAFVLAYLSYRFVETPFRRPRRPMSRPRLFAATAVVLGGLCALGVVGAWTDGASFLHPAFAQPAQVTSDEPDLWLSNRCFLENQDPSAWAGDMCVRTTGASRNALLWGDSFAAQYIPGLVANQQNLTRNIVEYTFAGCPPVLAYDSYARPGCHDFNARVFDVIARYHIDTVVLSARWDELRERGLQGLSETIAQLRANGLTVYVIGQSPMFAFDVKVLDYRGAGKKNAGDAGWYLSFGPALNNAVRAASAHADFIDPLPAFCHGDICNYKSSSALLFADYGHFSEAGSDAAVKSYFPLYRVTH
jgi:peptidoglycan/LPS O-acetylase OafA/YrhL